MRYQIYTVQFEGYTCEMNRYKGDFRIRSDKRGVKLQYDASVYIRNKYELSHATIIGITPLYKVGK